MIEIFKCLKGISPLLWMRYLGWETSPTQEEIQGISTVNCQKPSVYFGLETIAYKGPQLWQQLPEKTT